MRKMSTKEFNDVLEKVEIDRYDYEYVLCIMCNAYARRREESIEQGYKHLPEFYERKMQIIHDILENRGYFE